VDKDNHTSYPTLNIYDYFDHVFCQGSGKTYGYEPNSYIATYTVEQFNYETLKAIERKMGEMGLILRSMDVFPSEYKGKFQIRLFISQSSPTTANEGKK